MFNKDVLERVVATFAQSFLAVFTIGDMGSMKAAGLAGATAVLSLVKSVVAKQFGDCLLYTSPSPRDRTRSRMPSSA